MRADGDIDRDYFHKQKSDIEDRIAELTESIRDLAPNTAPAIEENFSENLSRLRQKLEESISFEGKVPDSLIEAFFEKIWVSKDEFRWYLRVAGRKTQSDESKLETASFTVSFEDAKSISLFQQHQKKSLKLERLQSESVDLKRTRICFKTSRIKISGLFFSSLLYAIGQR